MLLDTCKKYLVTIGAATVFFTACGDDKFSSGPDAIPNYKSESSLPNSCQMEIALVKNIYYACLKDEWVIVTDSAIVKQITEGINVEDLDFASIVANTSSSTVTGDGKQSSPSSESNNAGTSSSESTASSSGEGSAGEGNSSSSVEGGASEGNSSSSGEGGAGEGNSSSSVEGGASEGNSSSSVEGGAGEGNSSSSVESGAGEGNTSSSVEGGAGEGNSSSSVESGAGEGNSSSSVESSANESSSSSSVESSSSESIPDGYMKDSRDGKLYKIVVIGSQTWMAQNLNYEYKVKGRTYGNYCRDNNCTTYGRYYTWGAAMDSVNTKCGYKKDCSVKYPVKGICDDGWRLPNKTDWENLFKSAGGVDKAGKNLRSKNGWTNSIINGTDPYKFTALPAGFYENGYFREGGFGAFFWTSVKSDSDNAYYMNIDIDYNSAYLKYSAKNLAMSVRCVKN